MGVIVGTPAMKKALREGTACVMISLMSSAVLLHDPLYIARCGIATNMYEVAPRVSGEITEHCVMELRITC